MHLSRVFSNSRLNLKHISLSRSKEHPFIACKLVLAGIDDDACKMLVVRFHNRNAFA